MVDKFNTILNTLERKWGNVTVFALMKMDEFMDKWVVVISASWANAENRDSVFKDLRGEIIKNLSREETTDISRISIYTPDEHLIEELLKYKSGTIIENEKINGNVVHYAHILKSFKD